MEVYITYSGCTGGRWEKGDTVRAGDNFFLCKRDRKSSIGNGIFVHH